MSSGFYENLMTNKYVIQRLDIYAKLLLKSHVADKHGKIKVLDIGGYTGDFYEYLKNTYPDLYSKLEYTIFDFDEDALKIAKARGITTKKVNLHIEDISKYMEEPFDVIICTELLEHVLDPRKILNSIKENMTAKSICIISLPNENTFFHRIYSLIGLGVDACAFVPAGNHKHFHLPTIKQSREFVLDFLKIKKEIYYINMSGIGSHFGFFAKLLQLLPDSVWQKIADAFPGLFARGTVWLLTK